MNQIATFASYPAQFGFIYCNVNVCAIFYLTIFAQTITAMNSEQTRRNAVLVPGLLILLLFRFWFAAILPMTGDEAYFILWGEHPAGGYYDHPPMVGWWLTGLLSISRAEWVLRLPAIFLPFVLAGAAWWMVRPYGRERAQLAAILVLLQPANVWNVLITTDTPVILFSVLSGMAYIAGLRKSALRWYVISALLLGAAFMSKYFAALLGAAYVAHIVFSRRDAQRWQALAILVLVAMPAPLYNLYWNSNHAWVNLLFNFINRNDDARLGWQTPLLYLLSIVYLVTPFAVVAAWRYRQKLAQIFSKSLEARTALWLAGIPLLLFAALSLVKTIGLHWLLAFTPFVVIPFAVALPLAALKRMTFWLTGLALLHVSAIVVVAGLPVEVWKGSHQYDGIVLTVKSEELLAQMAPYATDYTYAMDGYSAAATLAYKAQQPVIVFGEGSYHARQDDFLTDWRNLDQKNILILTKSMPDMRLYTPYFSQTSVRQVNLHGAHFYFVLGQQFRYPAYRDTVLRRVREHYYRIPRWLSKRTQSPFDRYFPAQKSAPRTTAF
jgi:hypothetical protein